MLLLLLLVLLLLVLLTSRSWARTRIDSLLLLRLLLSRRGRTRIDLMLLLSLWMVVGRFSTRARALFRRYQKYQETRVVVARESW